MFFKKLCFFLLLRSLRISLVVAVVVALLFSLHPLHVEPVAWISSRKDVLWFLLCLAPVLGLFDVGGEFTADRYTYLALAGPALALAYGVDALKGRLFTVGVTALACLAILCAVHSYEQTKVWKNDTSLFTHGVRMEPRSATAQTNLASLYRLKNRNDLALAHYQKALKLDGSCYIIHYNIAQIQLKRSQFPEAMESCEMSLRSNSSYVQSHYLLAKLMEEHTDTPELALNHFKMAHELEANNTRNAISYALALARRKQYDEAHAVLQKVLQVEQLGVEDHGEINALIKKLNPLLSK